ncbi:MAG: protein phosphatase [Paracoccaceae bacterium]
MAFSITDLAVAGGRVALSPMPGWRGTYAQDLAAVLRFAPALVVSMTTAAEMGGLDLGTDLARDSIAWRHLPVADFGVPSAKVAALWPAISAEVQAVLASGDRVLVHCMGGCGRSGMAVLRLMVQAGEPPATALARLRAARSCAVETDAQRDWALGKTAAM